VIHPILPGATIGVLGGGQLGRMFAMAARRMGYRVHTLAPDDDTPTGQIQVAEMKKNDFLGEIAILCDVPRTATIKAREPLNTLKISKDTFYRMVGEFPTMAIEIMRELAHRVEDTNQKLREATANKAA